MASLSGCTSDGINVNVDGVNVSGSGDDGIDIQADSTSGTNSNDSTSESDDSSSDTSSDSSSDQSESRLRIEHLGSGDQVATYSVVFEKGSEVNHGGQSDHAPDDEIHGRFVAGRVSGGDTDAFTFTGAVDKIQYTGCVRFTLDGDVIEEGGDCGVTEEDIDETPQSDDPDDYRHHIKIEGRGPSGYTGDYIFYFTPGSNVTGDGPVNNYGTPYMYGTIVDGTQHFYYNGNITEWHYEGYLKITIDGEVVAESIPGREAQTTTYDPYTDQPTEYATDSPTEHSTSTEYPTSSPTESDTQTEYRTSTATETATATASPTETKTVTETPTPEPTDTDDNSTESS